MTGPLVLHGMDMKTEKDQEQKEDQSWRAEKWTDGLCPPDRVSVQETLYICFHKAQIISSLACGSHPSVLVKPGTKHFAFWQKTGHLLHLHLSTVPLAGKKHLTLDVKRLQQRSCGLATHLCCP